MGTFYDREIEYLESTGTQYIDTGVNLKQPIVAEYSLQFTSVSGVQVFFGVYTNASSQARAQVFIENTTWRSISASNSNNLTTTGTSGTANTTTIYNLVSSTSESINSNYTLFIFARNTDNNSYLPCKMRLYKLKITSGGTLVRDFIPVRVGNVGYMFDRVSCQLFGNAGTGDFVLGDDMYDSRVEYVGIRTLGQYIPTGYVPTGTDIRVDTNIRFQGYQNGTNYAQWFWAGSSADYVYYGVTRSSAATQLYIYSHNLTGKGKAISVNPSTGTMYNFRLMTANIYVNLTTYAIGTDHSGEETSGVLHIGDASTSRGVKEDIYYFKIYKGDELVRDLIPVRKGQVGYLYDKVTNQIFGANTGSLLLGADIPDVPTSYDAEVDYIVFDGTQSIDTGLHGNTNTEVKVVCKPTSVENKTIFGRSTESMQNRLWFGHNYYGVFYNIFNNPSSVAVGDGDYLDWAELIANKDLQSIRTLNKRLLAERNDAEYTDFQTPTTLKIGGFDGSFYLPVYSNFVGFIGAVQIKQDGVLVRDLIPVRKNGVGYLYDKITQKMFGNEFYTSFGIGKDKEKSLPILRRINNYFTRHDLFCINAEKYWNCALTWYYDTATSTAAQLYHGVRYRYEAAWGAVSGTNFTFWSTSYTGRHKTLPVKEGQKYLITANNTYSTLIVFCNDHVYAAAKRLTNIKSVTIGNHRTMLVTVPAGYSYMMISAASGSGSNLLLPDRITQLVGYGL